MEQVFTVIYRVWSVDANYTSGFIFTTSLPPTVLAGSLASIRVLRSDEGRSVLAVLMVGVICILNLDN